MNSETEVVWTLNLTVLMTLLSFQKKLHTITMESERLKSEITSRNDLLSRIDSETEVVELVSQSE